jgi:outer membrane protein insertion porin family
MAMTAFAEERIIIRDIQITGNKRVEAETVRAHLTFSAKQAYDAQKADESVKALFATGLFRDVRVSLHGRTAHVAVVENQLINRVAFEGNKEIKSDVLSKEVQLKPYGIFAPGRVKADTQRILELYRRQGYYAAQVEAKIIEQKDNRIDLVFEIREGPETKVVSINFIGNRSFSDSELRGAIATSESSLLDFLKPHSTYDPDRLNLDRELLRRHYLKNGFADMRVISAVADTDAEGKGFFLTFSIEEGPRYNFGGVELESTLSSLKGESLRTHVLSKSGEVYNAEIVDKTVDALTVAAAEQGEPFGQVRPRIERDRVTRTISVVYVIEQGPRVYIDRVNISGNRLTHDTVIRREFRIADGDAYNKVMVERARQRVLNLGFFKEVKVNKEPGSAPDRVNLNVVVEEQATGELSFAAGYSTTEGPIGEVSYTERNLLGTGQYLQVKISGSFVSGSAMVSWTEPRFLDRNIAFGVDAFVRNADYTAASGYTVAGYQDLRVGGTLRVGFPLTDELTIRPNYTLMLDNVYNVDPNASLAVKQIQGAAVISSVGFSLIYDTRNNRKNPTRGFYFQGTQDFAGAGGDVNYIRSTAELRAYYPVYQDITLAGRATGGMIMGWGGQNVRIVDAFYKGNETIRGFQPGGLGPRDAATGDALGGTAFYSSTAELRFPLPFVPQDLGLRGAIFTDAGSLFGTDAQKFAAAYVAKHGGVNTLLVQDSSIVRASAGASLIWDSPIGPLHADFTNVLKKAPFDKTQTFGFGASAW